MRKHKCVLALAEGGHQFSNVIHRHLRNNWECLSLEWSSALSAMNLPCFHMVDFENRQPPYDKWNTTGA
jgi:hypothetical protein